jgi:hypothetical protein
MPRDPSALSFLSSLRDFFFRAPDILLFHKKKVEKVKQNVFLINMVREVVGQRKGKDMAAGRI